MRHCVKLLYAFAFYFDCFSLWWLVLNRSVFVLIRIVNQRSDSTDPGMTINLSKELTFSLADLTHEVACGAKWNYYQHSRSLALGSAGRGGDIDLQRLCSPQQLHPFSWQLEGITKIVVHSKAQMLKHIYSDKHKNQPRGLERVALYLFVIYYCDIWHAIQKKDN